MRLNNLCDWALGSLLRCLIPNSTSTQLAEHAFSAELLSAQRMLVINEHGCQGARQVTCDHAWKSRKRTSAAAT